MFADLVLVDASLRYIPWGLSLVVMRAELKEGVHRSRRVLSFCGTVAATAAVTARDRHFGKKEKEGGMRKEFGVPPRFNELRYIFPCPRFTFPARDKTGCRDG